MYKLIVFIAATGLGVAGAFAQLPLNPAFQHALQSGTRTTTGEPGSRYFQNTADYTIRAKIDPEAYLLSGTETIVYTNNSPDELPQLVFRMYQDIMKKGFKTQEKINASDKTNGVAVSHLVVNGDSIDPVGTYVIRKGTNMIVTLNQPLMPGQKLTIDVGWSFQIPRKTQVRMGTYADTAMFIAYWFPQIAVYDDIDGWDMIDYLGRVEFYNEFGNFEVAVTVPDRYLMWATGVWQNPEDILQDEYLAKYRAAWQSDEVIRIVTQSDYVSKKGITLGNGPLTYRYKAEGVSDFAFCLSDFYNWDAASVVVDESGRRVYTEAVYNPKAKDFPMVAAHSREILADFSMRQPGIPYPYPKMTVFQGELSGGGMEYPMMVNDAASPSEPGSFGLTSHEIAHSYFPFYMGINERKYAWMDEGWASFFPGDQMEAKGFMNEGLAWEIKGFASASGTGYDPVLMEPSYELEEGLYYMQAYSKPATAYEMLRDVLGQEKFIVALHLYIERWHGKHPTPWDFFNCFNEAAGEDLSWFWKPWFFEKHRANLGLDEVEIKGKKLSLVVTNEGQLPLPLVLNFTFKNGETGTEHLDPSVWKENGSRYSYSGVFEAKVVSITLGDTWVPDQSPSNNSFPK